MSTFKDPEYVWDEEPDVVDVIIPSEMPEFDIAQFGAVL